MESHREEIAKLEALYAAHPEGRVFTHLAEAYRRAGELDRAREILEDGLRRHPDYSSAHVVLGRVLMDRDENDGAAAAFRRVLELDRHNLVALRSLGDLAERAGDTAAAVGYYRDLVALDPADDRLRLAVARLEGELETPAAPEAAVAFEPRPEPEPLPPPEPIDIETFMPVGEDASEDLPALDFPSLADNPTEIEEEEVVLEVEGLSLGWGAETGEALEPADEDAGRILGAAPDALAGEGLEAVEEASVEEAAQIEEPAEIAAEVDGAAEMEEYDVPAVGWLRIEEAPEEQIEESAEDLEDAGTPDTDWTSVEERAAAAWRTAEPTEAESEEAGAVDAVADAMEDDAVPLLEVEETFEVVFDPEPAERVPEEVEAGFAEFVAFAEPEIDGASERAGERMADAGAPAGRTEDEDDDAVVTATMAELYAQQGFYDRATDVYRQLLEQVPEDERLRERLEEIEALVGGAAAAGGPVMEEAEDAEEWTSVDAWTEHAGVAGEEETPYAWAEPEPEEDAGPSAGEYFASLLAWRPAMRTLELTAEEETGEASAAGDEGVLETGAVAAAYEEWFGDAPEAEGETEAEAEGDADLEMFRSWLQSLKK